MLKYFVLTSMPLVAKCILLATNTPIRFGWVPASIPLAAYIFVLISLPISLFLGFLFEKISKLFKK